MIIIINRSFLKETHSMQTGLTNHVWEELTFNGTKSSKLKRLHETSLCWEKEQPLFVRVVLEKLHVSCLLVWLHPLGCNLQCMQTSHGMWRLGRAYESTEYPIIASSCLSLLSLKREWTGFKAIYENPRNPQIH